MPRYKTETDSEAIARLLTNFAATLQSIADEKRKKKEDTRSEEYLALSKDENARMNRRERRGIAAEKQATEDQATAERMQWAQAQEARLQPGITEQSGTYRKKMSGLLGSEVGGQKADVMNQAIGGAASKEQVLKLRDRMNSETVELMTEMSKLGKGSSNMQTAPAQTEESTISFDDKVKQFHMARRNMLTKTNPLTAELYSTEEATQIAIDAAGFTDSELQALGGMPPYANELDKPAAAIIRQNKAAGMAASPAATPAAQPTQAMAATSDPETQRATDMIQQAIDANSGEMPDWDAVKSILEDQFPNVDAQSVIDQFTSGQ